MRESEISERADYILPRKINHQYDAHPEICQVLCFYTGRHTEGIWAIWSRLVLKD